MQAALLRVLQEREVTRVGDDAARAVDFRLVCATNRDLDAEVAAGRFRADLLYRVREVTVELPPLRARGDDALALAAQLLAEAEAALGTARHQLGADARAAIATYAWPGNVRELRAAMRRAAVMAAGPTIGVGDLGLPPAALRAALPSPGAPAVALPGASGGALRRARRRWRRRWRRQHRHRLAIRRWPAGAPSVVGALGPLDRPLTEARDAYVAAYCAAVLAHHGGNREAAAAALGISSRSLYRYLTGERA
jgi:DNA-binding NtrC family response regulator